MSIDFMGAWLLDTILITTLLMVAVLLVRRQVAKNFGPGVAYALWLIPAARLFMPTLEGPATATATGGLSVQDTVRESILAGMSAPESNAAVVSHVAAIPTIDYAVLGLTLWLGGAVLLFITQMIRYAAMRDDLLAEAADIATIDGIRIISSDQVVGPLAFGLFRRVIAVPDNFTKTFSVAERELALAHEMAHHKSGDLFANLAAYTVLCLLWFNPVAWMSWSAFRFDQEAACDARVLDGKDSTQREIYGRALARTAFDGVPTFATALNSPKTVIERLRRLTMNDTSKRRRSVGKFGIVAAAAIILPLTATIVPAINAQDAGVPNIAAPLAPAEPERPAEPAAPAPPAVPPKPVKIINISLGTTTDGKPDGKVVQKIMRDGTTYIFRSEKPLSDAEVDKVIADSNESRAEAGIAMIEAEKAGREAAKALAEANGAQAEANTARASAEIARGMAEAQRVYAIRMASAYVPEIDIKEITKNCAAGQPVTTNVEGFDGTNKSRVKIVMCGKGQARIAQVEAIKGLREARREIGNDKDMPNDIRKDVVKQLDVQIRKLEAQSAQVD
ncbi:M56 family metallopeptidase [Sphingorhabdus sp.]|uniref:M56 family metallopeptidase n=1 Tax=Sphingorhabdus sp. TaxID=1902408 RepID=UPI003983BA78